MRNLKEIKKITNGHKPVLIDKIWEGAREPDYAFYPSEEAKRETSKRIDIFYEIDLSPYRSGKELQVAEPLARGLGYRI